MSDIGEILEKKLADLSEELEQTVNRYGQGIGNTEEILEISKEQLKVSKQKNVILNEIVNRLSLIGGELGEIREQYIYSSTRSKNV